MFLRFGFTKTIVVSSSEVAREVLQKRDSNFSDRMVPHALQAQHVADFSITMLPFGHRWRTLRKIANTLLFSSKSLDANQSTRMKKMKDLVSYVRSCSHDGNALNIGQVFFDTSLNLLSNAFFSMDLADPNSELCREFKEVSGYIVRDVGRANLADLFPIFNGFDLQGITRLMDAHFGKVLRILDDIVEKRLVARENKTTQNSADILDALLNICDDKSEDFEFQQIRYILLDMFIAGSETTSSTLEWAMAELLHEPNKLKGAKDELDRVIGRGNFVKESDLTQLPYLQAILNETFRLHPALPLLLPRKASLDIEVHGYKVPKDSRLLVNVWAIGRDPSLWKNPNKFEPERFLNTNIDAKGNHFELLPFGSGRRICAGLPLAIRIMPLVLGNLINIFDWKLERGMEPQDMNMEDKFGIALQKLTPLYAIPVSLQQ